MWFLLLLFGSVLSSSVDTRVVIKQTYKHSPHNGDKYVINLPARVSQVQSVNWCSNSFIPLLGRAGKKSYDCKNIPLMNVPMYPSSAVEVDLQQAMLRIDPRRIARGKWDQLRSNLVIRSGCDDGEFEQIIRFNPESSDDDNVLDNNEIGTSVSPHAPPDNAIYYITLAGGALIMVATIGLVLFRRRSARIRNNYKKQDSGDGLYEFENTATTTSYFNHDDLLRKLGKGADPAFEANL